jgi:hypothetical protein
MHRNDAVRIARQGKQTFGNEISDAIAREFPRPANRVLQQRANETDVSTASPGAVQRSADHARPD